MRTHTRIALTALLISGVLGLEGCASTTGSDILPQGGPSMSQIYRQQYTAGAMPNSLATARAQVLETSSRTTQQRQYAQTKPSRVAEGVSAPSKAPGMLPNPTIVMHVAPHFDGNNQNYIPAHTAYTKLYKTAQFALPGEPTRLR